MSKSLPFTENAIARAIAGARKGGITVAAVRVEPDGAIVVLDAGLAAQILPRQHADNDNAGDDDARWLDVRA